MEAHDDTRAPTSTGSAPSSRPGRAVPRGVPGAITAGLLAGVAALCALAWTPPPGSLDDVFVVLADAREWLGRASASPAGPVESSTSPLDVGVKAVLLAALPEIDPLRASGWLALGLTVALGLLVAALASARGRDRGDRAAVAWVALVATGAVLAPGVAESAAYRMEGPLLALAWTAAAWAAATRRRRALVPCLVLLAITRPEGLLLAPVLGWIGGGVDRRLAVRGAAVGAALAAGVTGVRFALYGALVPNTYHAKTSDSRWNEVADGAAYLANVAATWSGAGVVLLALAVGLAVRARPRGAGSPDGRDGGEDASAAARRLLVLAALYGAVVVVSGGDGYRGARLAMPVGLTVWLAAAAAGSLPSVSGRRLVAFALVLQAIGAAPRPWPGTAAALEAVGIGLRSGPTGLEAFDGDARAFAAVREALGAEVFAHRHAQRFRWFEPEATILDLTGLTDAEVARRPAPGRVRFGRDAVDLALERRVGALHLDPLRARPAALAAADPLRALSDPAVAPSFGGPPYLEPELARRVAADYRGASFALPEAGGFFNLFVRADLAERFRSAGFSVGGG